MPLRVAENPRKPQNITGIYHKMPAVTRIGDATQGHCFHPFTLLSGSPSVFVNGRAIGTVGGVYPTHKCKKKRHSGLLSGGSATVFANGRAVSRIGDSVSCGDTVAQGSPTVFAGG